jgi:hypothetical protein
MVFMVVTGVHEGSCLSPLLFILFIRDLTKVVAGTAGIDVPVIGTEIVATLVYADDVAEMSKTHSGLQREINASITFFQQREQAVNPVKSELICFRRARAEDLIFECDFVGTTREYQYGALSPDTF